MMTKNERAVIVNTLVALLPDAGTVTDKQFHAALLTALRKASQLTYKDARDIDRCDARRTSLQNEIFSACENYATAHGLLDTRADIIAAIKTIQRSDVAAG